jgi:hypothetical protein
MAYQYHQGRRQARASWIRLTIAAGVILILPWLFFRVGRTHTTDRSSSDAAQKIYDSALDTGWQAAVAVQTAQTRQDWELVINQWNQAIELLQTVKQEIGDGDGRLTQKQEEYQQYRDYAIQQSVQQPPDFAWEVVTELAGDKSYILVDPDPTDAKMEGPALQLGVDHRPQNVDYINEVLSTLKLPPIADASTIQVQNDNQYRVVSYTAGELVLHRTLCTQSFVISDKYDCLWKITLSQR